MRKNIVFIFLIALLFASCNGGSKNNSKLDVEDQTDLNIPDDALYGIEQGYLKFTSNSGNIRELWFADYGKTQYFTVYSYLDGELVGYRSWILNSYSYNMNIGSKEMSKMPYEPDGANIFHKLNKHERENKEIEKIGSESYLGYYCDVFLTQRPTPTTTWMYKGIALKKLSDFRGTEMIMQAVEFEQKLDDFSIFELPEDVEIIGL